MTSRDIFGFARPYRSSLAALMALTVMGSLITLAIPWLAGHLVSGVLSGQRSSGRLVAFLLSALLILATLTFATAYTSSATSARILADLRVRIYSHLQALRLGFHQDRRQGDILALATFEVARLGNFLTGTVVALPARLLTAIGAVVLMFRIDPHLALLVPLLVPAFYIVLKLVGRRLRRLSTAIQQAEADVIATVEENLAMLPAIKSFAREEPEARRYRGRVDHAMRLIVAQSRIQATLEPVVGLISAAAAVLLLFVAGRNVSSGTMSSADLFSFLFYAALLTRPVGTLASTYGDLQSARGTLGRLRDVLGQPLEPGYTSGGEVAGSVGRLSFEDVGFHYPGRPPLLRGVSLEVASGEKIALVGENGAGKTTLMNLLLRFIVPESGTIRIDGIDIATLQIQQWRRQIGLVPQRALLFNGTVRANIAYGLDEASDDQVMRAARLSQALDFILALPNGLDTQIGDDGVRLSGGQRQRVSLARALVLDPPILLLDEATSMYDAEGEQAFVAACSGALKGRTVLFTTHRPASLAIADRIIRVGDGGVTDVTPARPDLSMARR